MADGYITALVPVTLEPRWADIASVVAKLLPNRLGSRLDMGAGNILTVVSALRNHTLGAGGPAKLAATRGGLLAWAEAEPGTHRSSRSGAEGIMLIFKPAGLRRRSRSCGS